MEFIPIKERLPDKNGRYLVICQDKLVGSASIGGIPWRRFYDVREYVVTPRFAAENLKVPYWTDEQYITHWTKLPEIPKELFHY